MLQAMRSCVKCLASAAKPTASIWSNQAFAAVRLPLAAWPRIMALKVFVSSLQPSTIRALKNESALSKSPSQMCLVLIDTSPMSKGMPTLLALDAHASIACKSPTWALALNMSVQAFFRNLKSNLPCFDDQVSALDVCSSGRARACTARLYQRSASCTSPLRAAATSTVLKVNMSGSMLLPEICSNQSSRDVPRRCFEAEKTRVFNIMVSACSPDLTAISNQRSAAARSFPDFVAASIKELNVLMSHGTRDCVACCHHSVAASRLPRLAAPLIIALKN